MSLDVPSIVIIGFLSHNSEQIQLLDVHASYFL